MTPSRYYNKGKQNHICSKCGEKFRNYQNCLTHEKECLKEVKEK